jgi:hypothetical protein
MENPKVSNIKTLANTGIFHIESLDIEFGNGAKRTYQRLNPKAMVQFWLFLCLMMVNLQ